MDVEFQKNVVGVFNDKVLSPLIKLINIADDSAKVRISEIINRETGLKNYTEPKLSSALSELREGVHFLEGIIELANQLRIAVVNLKEVTGLDTSKSIEEMIFEINLSQNNVMPCLVAFDENKIPVLIGLSGAGKSYTAYMMDKIVYKYTRDRGFNYTKMYKVFIVCSGMPRNEFWGGLDAMSYIYVGKFKSVWREAESNPDTLYYVILDELLDMKDIRDVFGESFANLKNMPSNLLVVGTGYNGYGTGKRTYTNMLKDDEMLDRFDLIDVYNVLEDSKSDDFKRFFDNIDIKSDMQEFFKSVVLRYSDIYTDNALVPRKVVEFIKADFSPIKEDYSDLIVHNLMKDKNYLLKNLFAKCETDRSASDLIAEFKEIWNAES